MHTASNGIISEYNGLNVLHLHIENLNKSHSSCISHSFILRLSNSMMHTAWLEEQVYLPLKLLDLQIFFAEIGRTFHQHHWLWASSGGYYEDFSAFYDGAIQMRGILFVFFISLILRSALVRGMELSGLIRKYSPERMFLELEKLHTVEDVNGNLKELERTKKQKDILDAPGNISWW